MSDAVQGMDRIRRPQRVGVREAWPSEPQHFTPWLAENLDHLDVLDLGPLSLLGMEERIPDTDRALDLLAETAEGKRVAIENQFGVADHDHLTRGLAYAVGLRASALVVIAEAHRPEFQAIAEYLNHAAESVGLESGGIGVYLVEVALERLDQWLLPRFELLQGPNRWLSATADSSAGSRLSSIEQFVALADDRRRSALREIIVDWQSRPGASISFSSTAVALRLPKPGSTRTVAALTVYADAIWINVGYLGDAAAPIGIHQEDIERLVRETWPNAVSGEKGYYWNVPAPRPSDARAFSDGLWSLWGHAPGPASG